MLKIRITSAVVLGRSFLGFVTEATAFAGSISLFLFCWATLIPAQTGTATLSGRVTDSTGAVVPEVEIQATNVGTNLSYTRNTNTAGLYVIPDLSPGRYQLKVRRAGFKEVTITGLVLNVQATISQNVTLEPGVISQTVTVTAEANGVETTAATVGTVIDRQFVENLPLNGRSFQSLIELTPGVVPSAANLATQGQFNTGDRSYLKQASEGANALLSSLTERPTRPV